MERAIGRALRRTETRLLCRAAGIDAIVELTGTVEHAARVTLEAIAHRKHVVLMNAELDGTIGPILKTYADRAGVVLTNADGDQPGVMMNLYRFVRGIGVKPVLCGNQGFARSVPQSDDPDRIRTQVRTETGDGRVIRRWHQDLVRKPRSSPAAPACGLANAACSAPR
jgi:predicted homoserine dehydrogenase-like protein